MNMRPHAHGPTNYGPILLSIPALGTMLLIFWVGQMNLLQSPFQSLVLVYFGVAIISGLITLVEVKQVNPNSAVQWCVLVSLFWPLAFPIYLLERISFGFPRYIFWNIAITSVFLFALGSLGYSIEKRRTDALASLENIKSIFQNAKAEGESLRIAVKMPTFQEFINNTPDLSLLRQIDFIKARLVQESDDSFKLVQ